MSQETSRIEGRGGCAARNPPPRMRDARSLTGAGGGVSRKRQGSETSLGERLRASAVSGAVSGDTHNSILKAITANRLQGRSAGAAEIPGFPKPKKEEARSMPGLLRP